MGYTLLKPVKDFLPTKLKIISYWQSRCVLPKWLTFEISGKTTIPCKQDVPLNILGIINLRDVSKEIISNTVLVLLTL